MDQLEGCSSRLQTPPRGAQLCCPQAAAGTEELGGGLHPTTGGCGEGQSRLLLLQWGEKGVKSRGRKDRHLYNCPLSPRDAWPREPGMLGRDGGVPRSPCVTPRAQLSGRGCSTGEQLWLLLLSPPRCLPYTVRSLCRKPQLGITDVWGGIFPE